MSRIIDLVNQAYGAWAKIEGFDPTGRSIHLGELFDDLRSISDSDHADDDGLTVFMVLRSAVRRHAAKKRISPFDIYKNQAAALAAARPYVDLLRLLDDKEATGLIFDFKRKVRAAAGAMGLGEVVEPILKNAEELAEVRRDALASHRYLSIHSFRRGERASNLAFNRKILKFWNVNSAIRAAELQTWDGVSCCLIRDPVDPLWSYFILLVKDGGNVTIWTDMDRPKHPLQKGMSRSRAQERRYLNRAFRLRFPYHLFDFEFDEEDRFLGEVAGNSLVRLNLDGVPVCELSSLDPSEVLWLVMMFHLIRDRPRHLEELSMTGEGLLMFPAGQASLMRPIGSGELKPLTREEISTKALVSAGVFEQEPTGQNEWMAERYGGNVPEQVFNLLQPGIVGAPLLLTTGGTMGKDAEMVKAASFSMAAYRPGVICGNNVRRPDGLIAFDPTVFGTAEQVESDRRWIARYNQAAHVGALAWKEFEDTRAEIWRWFEAAIDANWPNLLAAIAKGAMPGEIQSHAPGHKDRWLDFNHGVPQPGELLRVKTAKDGSPWFASAEYGGSLCRYRFDKTRYPHYRCWETGQVASVYGLFKPYAPNSLAQICGVSVEELPEVLQHWFLVSEYTGNSILQRLDPMDWAVENPWASLQFEVVVGLSISTYKRIKKVK